MSDAAPPFGRTYPTDADTVSSPPAGKVVRFRERPDDPETDPLVFEMWLAAEGSHGPMLHVHPEQTERLAVASGVLGVVHEGTRRTLTDGEEAVIPPGERHRFWNAGESVLHLRGSVTPGLRTEQFMRVTYGLARDGAPVTPSGMPLNALRLAVLLDEYDDMLLLASLPLWLQLAGIRLTAVLGRAVGYRNDYPEYR
ncbi:cupin domain-containing protein [Haloarcula litorea]|uniref:cupin domain-containing protein n=1 Tax=Haloarcula litorea TaxID=3032579 RepID=UPI0023E7B91F|nr:cupin domain-containing protein [Halomicroarcula sp. GDY20]